MTEVPRESRDDYTLTAYDDATGNVMHFCDFVEAGDEVSLYRDPLLEDGFFGVRKVYRDDIGEWRCRDLTAEENTARTARIIEEARRR